MSEAERKRRLDYKKNRKKWIQIQAIAILVLAVLVLTSVIIYYQLNKTYYINYTEGSQVDYQVQLKENEFYDKEWIGKDQAYIASLINRINAKFDYHLNMQADKVNFQYKYRVEACLLITDKHTGTAIYDPVYSLKDEQALSLTGNKLSISENIDIDYIEYNDKAKAFVRAYNLKDVTSTLVVTMYIDVNGACDQLKEDSVNHYAVSLNIPLTTTTVEVMMTSSVDEDEVKVLECSNSVSRDVFLVLGIVFGVIDAILALILLAFVYMTRNEDINYSIKVKKLFSSYRSYIQKITNAFNTEGYQILYVSSFMEMLGIRDTLQSPVLMSENEDETCTQFLVPTSTKILYIYEIKVDNYDELYRKDDTAAEESYDTSIIAEIEAEEKAAAVIKVDDTADTLDEEKEETTADIDKAEEEADTAEEKAEAPSYNPYDRSTPSYNPYDRSTPSYNPYDRSVHVYEETLEDAAPVAISNEKPVSEYVSASAASENLVKVRKIVTVTKRVNGGDPNVTVNETVTDKDLGIGPNGGRIRRTVRTSKTVTIRRPATVALSDDGLLLEETVRLKTEDIDRDKLNAALSAPDVRLSTEDAKTADYEGDDGIEVVGVIIADETSDGKPVSYDPDGEALNRGDIVLVPKDQDGKESIKKGTVASGNHKVSPDEVTTPLKKILGVVKRRVERALYGDDKK